MLLPSVAFETYGCHSQLDRLIGSRSNGPAFETSASFRYIESNSVIDSKYRVDINRIFKQLRRRVNDDMRSSFSVHIIALRVGHMIEELERIKSRESLTFTSHS